MGTLEKKIVTSVVFGFAVLAGYFIAEDIYNIGMTSYMKTFHKDLWNAAVNELSYKDLA